MKKLLLTLVFTIFTISQTFAQTDDVDKLKLSAKGTNAYNTLLKVNLFAIGEVGFAGTISSGEIALRNLMKETESVNAFKLLVSNASREGGLYALLGLRSTDCDCFDEEAKRYLELTRPKFGKDGKVVKEKRNIMGAQGCMLTISDSSSAVTRIQSGMLDHGWLSPEQILKKMETLQKTRKKDKSVT